MPGNEHGKHAHQQLFAFDIRREQHEGQRHQRYHPCVHGNHQPHLRHGQAETLADVGEQGNGDEFGRIDHEGGADKYQHAQVGHFESFDFFRHCYGDFNSKRVVCVQAA